MPHIVLSGGFEAGRLATSLEGGVHRWGRAVLKFEETWLRRDGDALLVEGLVVEFSRPQHPVAVVEPRKGDTMVRLWRRAPVERTPSVQRWLALLAAQLQCHGLGEVRTTNLTAEILSGLDLRLARPPAEGADY